VSPDIGDSEPSSVALFDWSEVAGIAATSLHLSASRDSGGDDLEAASAEPIENVGGPIIGDDEMSELLDLREREGRGLSQSATSDRFREHSQAGSVSPGGRER
jgi:hypothetical protein